MKHYIPFRFSTAIVFSAMMLMPVFQACDSENDEPTQPVPTKPAHYDGLENVTIPKGLASQIKDYTGFTLSFNKDNRTPNYVAWELLGTEVSNEVSRTDNFWQDDEITNCTKHSD